MYRLHALLGQNHLGGVPSCLVALRCQATKRSLVWHRNPRAIDKAPKPSSCSFREQGSTFEIIPGRRATFPRLSCGPAVDNLTLCSTHLPEEPSLLAWDKPAIMAFGYDDLQALVSTARLLWESYFETLSVCRKSNDTVTRLMVYTNLHF